MTYLEGDLRDYVDTVEKFFQGNIERNKDIVRLTEVKECTELIHPKQGIQVINFNPSKPQRSGLRTQVDERSKAIIAGMFYGSNGKIYLFLGHMQQNLHGFYENLIKHIRNTQPKQLFYTLHIKSDMPAHQQERLQQDAVKFFSNRKITPSKIGVNHERNILPPKFSKHSPATTLAILMEKREVETPEEFPYKLAIIFCDPRT